MRLRVSFVALCLSLLGATALPAQATNPMVEMIEQWETAFNARDYDAVASFYTNDAVRMPPGADPLIGREAIRANMGTFSDLTIDVELGDSAASGDLMTSWGTYTLYPREGDTSIAVQSGPWMNLSVRGDDGTWKIYRDIWNERIDQP